MAKEFICGQMEGNMKENLVMINKMGLANAIILMEKSMKVNGWMDYNMDKVFIIFLISN